MTQSIALNAVQLAFVLLLSPLFAGILARCKELVQSKRGPSIFQPYRDLRKLFGKDERISENSSWIFRAAPYFVFVVPLIVTLLIPVLTDFPLFFAFAGDMLGAGFIFAISGMFFTLAAIDGGNPYGAMGASRTRMVGFLAEPVIIIVLFTVSFVANSTIPYIVQQHWVHPPANFFAPSHVLLLLAFFMVLLAETGRLPVDNPSGHFELAMIDESKALEFSGRSAALIKWGGYMKFVVLAIVFLNVLMTPWGLSSDGTPAHVAQAVLLVAFKILLLIGFIAAVESSYSKLRLFRISEYLAAAFVVSVTAMITEMLHL
ncbi:MAG TPA: NADH-quinone oxidoreductase subunit H [Alphaproteobacteria bacterium]|nr:NADH-quinone oxidoreductase subunit H [Candidatus Acidoferrales bacterium]HUN28925.1 NADH-quinone oxidoreductase subunit H [Alphaproteobacteria bacterium]